jgi:anti-sigma B factor antagonist
MSNLTISTRRVDDVVIVDLDGEVTLGTTNRQLHTSIHQLVKEGDLQILLNLANVKRIDSSGLGEIVAGFSTLRANGGSLKLINMPSRVSDLMTITKLYTVFDIYETEADGVNSFEGPQLAENFEVRAKENVTQFRKRAGGLS